MPTYDFPMLLDNTALSSFKKCPMDWHYSAVRQITKQGGNLHLHFGGAFAAGLEAARRAYYDDDHSEEAALKHGVEVALAFWETKEMPEGFAKNADTLVGALFAYFIEYPLATDFLKPYRQPDSDSSCIEFTFSIPLDIRHPQTGDPILYGGRFDMLAEKDGVLFVEDDKTASQLGSQWLRNWLLDSQFTGYCWAAQEFGFPVAGAIIRGVSILKNGFGHAQSIVYRPQWQLDRWLETTTTLINQMIAMWETDSHYPVLDKHACNSYGGCAYHQLCESPNPESWIEMNYEPRIWNPTHK
jgi:hypothetical protein